MSNAQETSGLETADQAIDRLEDYTVVDCDVHEINVDTSSYEKYLDSPWDRRVSHLSTTEEPLVKSLCGSFPFDLDPTPHGLGKQVKTTTVNGLQNFMDQFKTDYILLHGHQVEGLSSVPERKYAAALSSAHNDYLLDEFLDEDERLKSSLRIASQAPMEAVEEIERLADEDDMVSIHIPSPINGLLGNPEFEPIYEIAEEKGLPITYHPGMANPPWSGPFGGQSLHSSVELMATHNQPHLSHITSLIFQGIPEKYPGVTHVFLEQGIAWLPWLMGKMDKNYERRKHELPWLNKKPSEYLKENFYFGTQPLEEVAGPAQMTEIFDIIDADDMLMYTSDFPHFDFDFPSVLTIPRLTSEEERKIFGENALEVFDF